jgi:hypothetical protein
MASSHQFDLLRAQFFNEEKAATSLNIPSITANASADKEHEQEQEEEHIVPYMDAELLAAVCSPEQLQMVEQIKARRGGRLLNLDRMLLVSEYNFPSQILGV